MQQPIDYMKLALALAEKGRKTVSPNPMVGCVIVNNGYMVGQGYHQRAGGHHAEIEALNEAQGNARGATVYVTLEPCNHTGLTPPCTTALIQAGVQKVVIACMDPNPLVAGQGMAALKAAGIEVEIGLCEKEAQALNKIFFHYITQKRPYVIAKWAMSLDGKATTASTDSRQISGKAAQEKTHQLREQIDAILIGANTAKQDNPQLTARCQITQALLDKQPIRIILSSQGELPSDLHLLHLAGKTIVASTRPLPHLSVEVLVLPSDASGQVSLPHLLDELGKRKITSLLVEGGMRVHESFIKENLINEWRISVSPVFIGSLEKKIPLQLTHSENIGEDIYIQAGVKHV